MSERFRYFVEGPCEKALIKAFMFRDGPGFIDGQVEVFNFVNERLSAQRARTIRRDSKIALVVDTDVERLDLFEENIKTLEKTAMVKREDIFVTMSVSNFEEEIVFACSGLSNIHELFGTKGIPEFKRKFIAHKDIYSKLIGVGFDIKKIWSREPINSFSRYSNDGSKIKRRHQST